LKELWHVNCKELGTKDCENPGHDVDPEDPKALYGSQISTMFVLRHRNTVVSGCRKYD